MIKKWLDVVKNQKSHANNARISYDLQKRKAGRQMAYQTACGKTQKPRVINLFVTYLHNNPAKSLAVSGDIEENAWQTHFFRELSNL